MGMSALFNALQNLGTDDTAANGTVKEIQADIAEKNEFCGEPRKKGLGRGLQALNSILEEKTNKEKPQEDQSADSDVGEYSQEKRAKGRLGRGMRVLLQD